MNRALSFLLKALGLVVVALPVSIVATFLLSPFWSWLEATTGVESIGHSGPADWCYLVVLLLVLAVAVLAMGIRRRARRGRGPAA